MSSSAEEIVVALSRQKWAWMSIGTPRDEFIRDH